MGRRGPLAALLIALALTGASDALPIREARWTVPERRLAVLTTEPSECLVMPAGLTAVKRIAIGRVAFRTPLLLGGQAARAGLSCASCHRNGRGNPDFVFPGLSGAPGTADVTASLMSSHRGDGSFNPKPIPDLATDAPKVPRDQLPRFVEGLIVEEFDGPAPPRAVLDGLVAYVGAMHGGCRGARAVTMTGAFGDAHAAALAAVIALDMAEPATARLMLGGARGALGRVDERLAGAPLKRERALVRGLDAEMLAFQLAIDRGEAGVGARIDAWLPRLAAIAATVGQSEKLSLYDPDRLAAALSASRTP